MAQKSHNVLSDRWIALKYLIELSEVVFLGVAMESLLTKQEVQSCLTRITAKKGHNFRFDRWMPLKVL